MAMPNPPAPPPPTPPVPPQTWMVIVGAIFGAITLLGFFAFAFLAISYADVVCRNYLLFGIIFALGAALSTTFLGGYAAATGQFGNAAQNKSLQFSAGGGVAVLIIIFVVFYYIAPKPDSCEKLAWRLHLNGIAADLTPTLGRNFWHRRTSLHAGPGPSDYKTDIEILIGVDRSSWPQGPIQLYKEATQVCWIYIAAVGSSASIKWGSTDKKQWIPIPAGSDIDFSYHARSPKLNSKKEASNVCFKHIESGTESTLMAKLFFIPTEQKLAYVESSSDVDLGDPEHQFAFDQRSPTTEASFVLPEWLYRFANAVAAESGNPSYDQLRKQLSNRNANVRVAARRFLGAKFDLYKDRALADLFSKPDNDLMVSLLHGLIAGIDKATNGRLSPAQSRDLSVKLPYLDGHMSDIVQFTGDPRDEVNKQARRLIQRFPVDGFGKIYDEFMSKFSKECNTASDSDRLIKYGSIFYYYNRVVQYAYESTLLDTNALSTVDSLTAKALLGAECLAEDLRVDAAAVYFARAFVFDRKFDNQEEAAARVKAETKKFNDYVAKFGGEGDYYESAHIQALAALQKKYGS